MMRRFGALYAFERRALAWMKKHHVELSRLSLGIIFIWFGLLKVLGVSPANQLVADTLPWDLDPAFMIPFLGWWEVAIGVCFIDPLRAVEQCGNTRMTRAGLVLMAVQMPATFLPIVVLPERVFTSFPHALTMEGQYILKNLVLLSAAAVVAGATYRESRDRSQRRPVARMSTTQEIALGESNPSLITSH